jgi:hypothetical protein
VNNTPTISLDLLLKSAMLGYLGIPLWACSMASTKISVCLTLLRFEQRRSLRILSRVLIGVLAAFAVVNVLFPLLQCRPIQAAWDLSLPRTMCESAETTRIVSNTASGVNIATDLLLSILPLSFIIQLQRTRVEKSLLIVLLGLGLLASAASIAKTVFVQRWGVDDDFLAVSILITICTVVEELVSVFAACAPWLKGPLQTLLEVFGVPFGFRSLDVGEVTHEPPSPSSSSMCKESIQKTVSKV